MSAERLVTVVGATGSQGGSVLRALLATNKYKIRGLTRDAKSERAKAIKCLSNRIEMVSCDIKKKDDIMRAFKDSWAVFAVTDFWAQPDQPEVEFQLGTNMVDVAASLGIPYFIFSALEDTVKASDGKYDVPHFTQKGKVRDYIKEKYPALNAIYVELGTYMQNWASFYPMEKLTDGTVVFRAPLDLKTPLYMVDVEDTGLVAAKILDDPDKYVGQDICICGEALPFDEVPKVFTKVTGIPAIAKTLSDEEYRLAVPYLPKIVLDEILCMFKWFEEYGFFSKHKDWKNGQSLATLTTFEQWLQKSRWRGP